MKKLTLFMLALFAVSLSVSQDISRFPSKLWQKDTLTTAQDTMDVSFNSDLGITSFVITARTISGADTLQVYLLAPDDATWVQNAVVDMSELSSVASIVVSTTAKDYTIADPMPSKIRLISTSNDGSSTIVIVSGRVIPKGE